MPLRGKCGNFCAPAFAARAALAFALAAALSPAADAVSMRRGIDAPSPTRRARRLNPPPERDLDVNLGKIVRKDGNVAIVNIVTNFRSPDRKAVFFGCDVSMTPTSILRPLGITHRTCAAFEISEGSAALGDSVMVKYFAPEKDDKNPAGQ